MSVEMAKVPDYLELIDLGHHEEGHLMRLRRNGQRSASAAVRSCRRRPNLERLEERALLSLNFNFVQSVSGTQIDVADVATDSSGNFYLSGSFFNTVDFDPNSVHAGDTDILTATARDAFVAKYSSTGAFLWVRKAGGSFDDRAIALTTDPSGNVYATGFYTGQASFGTGLSLNDPSGGGVFVWRLDTNGTPLWVVGPTGTPNDKDQGYAIALDSGGNVVLTGQFEGTATFSTTGGSVAMTAGGVADSFVAKLTPAGSFLWAKQLKMQTSTDFSTGLALASDNAANLYVTGTFSGTIDLDPGAGTDLHTSPGSTPTLPTTDAFLVKLDGNGNFVWSRTYGSTDIDEADGIVFDGTGNLYVTGRFGLTVDLDPTSTHPGNVDILTAPAGEFGLFALRITTSGTFVWATNLKVGNTHQDIGRPGIALDSSGNVFVGGSFTGTANIGPVTLGSAGDSDVFVIRLNTSGTILDGVPGGGSGFDTLWGLVTDPSGRVLFAASVTAPATFGGFQVPDRALGGTFAFGSISNVTAARPPTQGDFDGDHKADLALYRPPTGQWFELQSTAGPFAKQFGQALADIPIAADFDGDGRTDLAVFRPSTATWYILQSSGGARVMQFGGLGDIPIAMDFDGDHKADLAVFRPSNATWYILQSTAGPRSVQFGGVGIDQPVPADYDGDGRTDIAVFRASTAQWLILQSTGGPRLVQFGAANLDLPIPADYDGDGKADIAVLRPDSYTWFIRQSTSGARSEQFGAPGDIPMPEDYDGDGRADLGVFRPSNATWYILQSTAGARLQQFGGAELDYPEVPFIEFRYRGDSSIRSASLDVLAGSAPDGGTLSRTALLVPLVPADAPSATTASSAPLSPSRHAGAIDLTSAVDELAPGSDGTSR